MNPWSGGLNNIQLGEIDLNNDGFNDIVSFDRHGNRLLPFILEVSLTGIRSYRYDPQYRSLFPPINSIFQLHDYNNDNKPDIFTYTTGGLMVYKNVSDQQLRFEKAVKQFIQSMQGNIFTNLLVTNVDYPAIYDLDNDSDLDILTFWGLGSFVELHKNMSVETYGNSDSLLFHKIDYCWGNFSENAESNDITLDTCVELSFNNLKNTAEINRDRHTGSTLAVIDINDDSILDLLLGDVDYMNIQSLINGGSNLDAMMVSHNDSFPSFNPVNLASFPAVQQIDLFNDNINDLIISPFDPGLTKSAGYNSVWHYSISSSNGEIVKESESFLQNEMIDIGLGCYPVFTELTGDSLVDLIISNYGKLDSCYYNNNGQLLCSHFSSIRLYRNTGTKSAPEYSLISDDLASLADQGILSIYPTFGDFNGDQLTDMVIGSSGNKLLFYFNQGYLNNLPQFSQPQELITGLTETYLTPAAADINKDGLLDLLIGNRLGTLSLILNEGTLQNPNFIINTHNFGQIDVRVASQSYTGFSVPALFPDKQNNLRLIVGSESGKLHYYSVIPTSDFDNQIIEKADVFSKIIEGIRTSVAVNDINSDGFPDMAVGNYAGGVTIYKGEIPGPQAVDDYHTQNVKISIYPNPASSQVYVSIDGNQNITEQEWNIRLYNTEGELMMEEKMTSNKALLKTNRLKSGLYVIVASQPGSILIKKLVITQ